ncbi:MAG TPA: putative Ig domain-containing protein [Burkholderiales bacterium]
MANPSNGFPADFSQAVPKPIVDLGLAELARCGTYLAWLTNQDGALSSQGEAYARVAAALLASTAFGPKEGFERLVRTFADNLYAADWISATGRISLIRLAPPFLRALAASPAGLSTELAAQYAAIVFEAAGSSETVQAEQGFGERLVELILDGGIPDDTPLPVELDKAAERVGAFLDGANGLSKTEAFFRALVCFTIAVQTLPSSTLHAVGVTIMSNLVRLATEDVPDFIAAVYREVAKALRESAQEQPELFAAALIKTYQSLSESLVGTSKTLAEVDAAQFSEDVQTQISDGLADFARSLSNAYEGLSSKHAGIFEWGASVDRSTLDGIIASLLEQARSTALAVSPPLASALQLLQDAAQTVVIRSDRAANPFDDGAFDPDSAPLANGTLSEGSLSTWTVYLPYEAAAGGQRIRLDLAGADLGGLSVLADGEAVDIGADGTFTVTVPEGSREATIEIAALADLDADREFTLSATLVNAAGEATHLEHEEARISLDAVDEAPGTTVREIRGDWAPFTDPQTGAPLFQDDGFGNIARQPGVPNVSGFSEPDNKLDGSPDADHIVTGDYEDTVYGFAGDDAVEGSDLWGSVFFGGAGNDWLEAGRYDEHASDYSEFTYLGRTVRLGEDRLYGGAGNDRIYGDREADLAALYDPSTAPTGLPGDWSSGGSGDDEIYGGAGEDVLMGGAGEDRLVAGAGMDVLIGDDHFLLRPEGSFWAVVHPNFGDSEPGFGAFEVGLFPVVNATLDFPELVFPQTGDPDFSYYANGGGDDVLIGGAGKDILIGQTGDDTVYGGEDDDIAAGWEGDDRIVGGSGDDMLAGDFGRYEQPNQRQVGSVQLVRPGVVGSSGAAPAAVEQTGSDFLDGGAGNDRLWGEGGDDVVLGGGGNDALHGDAPYLPDELHGADRLDGGAGDDELHGGGGNDTLFGGSGDDTLTADDGDDVAEGGVGDDQLSGGEGADVLDGGAGADLLAGDAGGDTLRGGEGDDELDGGDGNDSLDGGSGDDLLVGGLGDDMLDGGAGSDILAGGAGDDTYVLSLGYGADRIDDSEGASRLRFGSGIVAQTFTATLDAATLTAEVSYGFPGDAVSIAMNTVEVGGVDFADGTAWSAKQLLALVPALVTSGSNERDVLAGNASVRNELRGLAGNDQLAGSDNDDTVEGGDGGDVLDGGLGGDRYLFSADETGIDVLSDSGVAARAYLEWFYGSRGIADWQERGLHGGEYRVEASGEEGSAILYFDTLEEAVAAAPEASIALVEPLPEIAPLVRRDDEVSLSALVAAGVLDRDTVVFGAGIHVDQLDLTLAMQGGRGTLSVRWGDAGFDVAVPDVQYGFAGSDLFADGVPDEEGESARAWRGYRLGEGIEAFEFADGSAYSLGEILERATPVQAAYAFHRGSGSQVIDPDEWSVVRFDADIDASEISAARDGRDLIFGLADGSADGRIVDWYADPATVPALGFLFADGTALGPDDVTRLGLTQVGTADVDLLEADPRFASALYGLGARDFLDGGAGNDLLDGGPGRDFMSGGAGDDLYVYAPGYGNDTVDEHPEDGGSGFDTVRFGEGIAPDDVSVDRDYGDLVLTIGTGDDVLLLSGWLDVAGGSVERFLFADGTVWTAGTLAPLLPPADEATEEDDALYGAFDGDVLNGLAGDDEIAGFAGDDILNGGDGDDYLEGGSGNDILRGGDGMDDLEEFGAGNNLVDAGPGDDLVVVDGHSLVIGGAGDDWIENNGSGSVILFNPGDGHDTIYAYEGDFALSLGGGLTAADLSLTADGDDLVLAAGAADSIRFTRRDEADPQAWPEITLQMFGSVHAYDFNAVINELRAAGASAPLSLDGVLQRHETSSSDDAALGGALAWQYAKVGSLDALPDSAVGSILSAADFGSAPQPISEEATNRPPTLEHGLTDRVVNEDESLAFAVPGDAFSDADGDVLTYTATLAGGDPLPDWLAFDAATGAFSGTPTNADVGTVIVAVSAIDPSGASAPDTFDLTVVNINDSPLAGDDVAEAAEDGGAVLLSAAMLLGNDRDEDAGDELSIVAVTASAAGATVQLLNGAVVYDPGSLFQALSEGESTADTFAYTVADAAGVTSNATVTVTIAGANDAPGSAAPLGDQQGVEGSALAFAIPPAAFTDVDSNDVLTLHATLADGSALPGWLSFAPSTGRFLGAPALADGGDYVIRLTVSDTAGASASGQFVLTIADSLAHGATIIGTRGNDVLNGTSAHERLDGREGADQLFGGDGDDVLTFFADAKRKGMGRSLDLFDGGAGFDTLAGSGGSDAIVLDDHGDRPRFAAIERIDAGGGHDLVDLRSQRFSYGDVIVEGGSGNDELRTSSGSDMLVGGRGHDELAGGSGDDVYFYALGDGHDTVRDSAGADTVVFGDGIRRSDLRVQRHHDDLVVRMRGRDAGSLMIAEWFAAGSNRIEQFQFVDGSAWDAAAIEAAARGHFEHDEVPHLGPRPDRRDHSPRHNEATNDFGDHGEEQESKGHSIGGAIARILARLTSIGEGHEAIRARTEAPQDEIARQWAEVQRFARSLTYEADDDLARWASPEWQNRPLWETPYRTVAGFGFEGSVGLVHAPKGFEAFAGLDEGFRRL